MPIRSLVSKLLPLCLALLVAGVPAQAQQPPPDSEEKPPERPEHESEIPEREAEETEDEKEEEAWDVNDPPGEEREVAIDVRRGTWMSLDVSPDGRTIVFDLLGDLYTMPIEGGEATAITSGMAWDMQPAFSPDGRRIAFTSDRSGGDNLWILPVDDGESHEVTPNQVTKETFRLVNSPAWSPDGEFLVGRKHFTDRRSLGAGEMWLYHRSGEGSGLQMTERPNEQKDAGEPAFSTDGRYLYFSQDTTPGPVFEYNKDPNTQIYVVQRLDRETGDLEPFVTGPGGAVRPTPSPDGSKLAFVRRVRYETVLHLMDLESGEITPLVGGLERDLQETWAVHGVYPRIAWTPDSRSIVYWADGGIHRVDVGTGEVREIPFHVKDSRRVSEVVRFPVEVAPERFPVKMLRWVRVSPGGDRVVFQALGRLWVRDLPDGDPRRLTRQDDHFELYPAWSRDGKSIVYTTWDDEELGSVRVVAAGGGEGRVLTSRSGHFVEPVFSTDGSNVVYRKVEGGFLRSPAWSFEPGLYVVPSRGGEARRLLDSGVEPQFADRDDRVYYTTYGEDGVRELHSIEIDGSDERTHLTSKEATEMALSPDGRWLAFTERFNAWVMPFVPTGRTVEIGPDAEAVPQTRVSRDAGEYVHWSGDSRSLHWALGPELFTRELAEIFAFVEGAPEEMPEPPAEGVHVGFTTDHDSVDGLFALVGGRVVTMRGDEVIEDGTVVVRGRRIEAVGPSEEVEIPAGAEVVDASGHTVLPGLIDVHWHGAMASDEITPEQNWYLHSSLAFGVTTIHDPSNDTSEIFAVSEMQRAGIVTGPRIFSTGTILYGARSPVKAVIDSLDDALSHLRRLKAVGAITVKSYNQPRRDQRQQVIAAARELEMMVVPEGGSLFQHNMSMVVDGHTGIEHAIPVAGIYDDVLQLWGATEVSYTPTLVVGYGGWWGENYWYMTTDVWAHERLLRYTPREYVDPVARRRTMIPEEELNHRNAAEIASQLADRGVEVQLGAHGQREGLGAHWEIWMFVQGGMTPHQALRAATLWGASYLGMDGDLGSLEPGKLADVIVVAGNPLEDIRTSENVRYTVADGRLFDALEMNQLLPEPKERAPFYFEAANREAMAAGEGDGKWAAGVRLGAFMTERPLHDREAPSTTDRGAASSPPRTVSEP